LTTQIWHKPSHSFRIFLGGDVMTGRAIDQLFPIHNADDFGKPGHVPGERYRAWSAALSGPLQTPVEHAYIWGDALAVFDSAQPDFRLVNLEAAITRSDAWEKKGFNFRMHPDNAPCLSAAKIDCCALANNHTLDFGHAGLVETIESLARAGIGHAGAGRNSDEAQQAFVRELPNGKRLLVFSWGCADSGIRPHWQASQCSPGVNFVADFTENTAKGMAEQVQSLRRPGDISIASIHWGENWVGEIPARHRWLARYLIDHAGIDVVHGHSSHHPLGMEIYGEKLVLYGCGDLINDYEGKPQFQLMKPSLGALYFADLDIRTGNLQSLMLHPVQRRRFRLETPSSGDGDWLMALFQHFNSAVK
jgi:poly-gamma-glutamate synthesis protein (capsule biosynthesis protein)